MDSSQTYFSISREAITFVTGVITGGGLLTVWKWIAGWNYVNMSVAIENRRTKSQLAEHDDLVTLIKLKKGDRAALALDEVRLEVEAVGMAKLAQSASEVMTELGRKLNLTPGEETLFAFVNSVPKTANCKVIVTVTGKTLGSRYTPARLNPKSIWKATEISCPIPQTKPKTEP